MGKRKKEKRNSKIRRKIQRLEQKLCSSSTSSTDESDEEYHRYYSRSRSPDPVLLSSQSERSGDEYQIKSAVISPAALPCASNDRVNDSNLSPHDPGPSTSRTLCTAATEVLPPEILEALGDPISKDEILGPAINDEIAKRWGRVLVEGMTREMKDTIVKKTTFPENFTLPKAPKLNIEISAVLSESIKNRDKFLEKAQNQLGLGIAGLTYLASSLIKEDLPKVEILKKISDISQIFLDLHYENTKHRRKLITTSLDKKFTNTITDVKRDTFLFGADLGEKIKATKTAEKSGLQIKRKTVSAPPPQRPQVNWRGPPRYQPTRAPKPGGQKPRYPPNQGYIVQQGRRPMTQTPTSRAPPVSKTDYRPRRNQ